MLRRVLEAVGRDLAVICKYSVTEGAKGGHTAEDGAGVARILEGEGAHLLVLSAGMNVESTTTLFGSSFPKENRVSVSNPIVRAAMTIQSFTEPKVEFRELYLLEHARKVCAAVDMPLAYLGGVKTAANVIQALGEGFEAVALGRGLIFDPELVNQMAAGGAGGAGATGCTSCNRCSAMMYTPGDAQLNAQPAGS